MFTETRTLNLQRTPSLRLLSIMLQTSSGQLGSNLKAWREAVITGAPPEVFLPILPSDGWRVLPADLQVYPPIWRAGGRLAKTLPGSFRHQGISSYNIDCRITRPLTSWWQGGFRYLCHLSDCYMRLIFCRRRWRCTLLWGIILFDVAERQISSLDSMLVRSDWDKVWLPLSCC